MKIVTAQFSMNAGIYSAELAEREDTEAFYASVADMMNLRPKAEGGADLREGLVHAGMMRGALAAIDLTAVTFAAGGSASLDTDGDTVTAPTNPDPPVYPGDPDPEYPYFPPYDTISDLS